MSDDVGPNGEYLGERKCPTCGNPGTAKAQGAAEERAAWEALVKECIDSTLRENVPALREICGSDDMEARCRELAALYMSELLECRRLQLAGNELSRRLAEVVGLQDELRALIDATRGDHTKGTP